MWLALSKSSFLALFFACACTLKPSNDPPMRLYLASSLVPLKDSLEKMAPTDVSLDLQFLSSSMIAQQLSAGAPCDAIVLADKEWRDYLQKKQVILSSERTLATNSLIIASLKETPSGNVANILKSLPKEQKLIIADPDYVPLGRYSEQAIKSLGLWDQLKPNMLFAHSAHNARVLLEQGAAPLALLYKSDLQALSIKQLAEFDQSSHKAISYVFLRCNNNTQAEAAERLFFSPEFKKALSKNNFGLP